MIAARVRQSRMNDVFPNNVFLKKIEIIYTEMSTGTKSVTEQVIFYNGNGQVSSVRLLEKKVWEKWNSLYTYCTIKI